MKKTGSCILVLAMLLSLLISIPVNAETETGSEEHIKLEESDAISMAEKLGDVVRSEASVEGDEAIKFYDTSGQAIGYIVNLNKDNKPYGYVIIDSTADGAIGEYSLGDSISSPYENALEQGGASVTNSSETKLYKLDAFTYGIDNGEEITTNTGDCIDSNEVLENETASSGKTHEWEDIFVKKNLLLSDYELNDANYTDYFIAFTEDEVENETGKYACAVTAMAECAEYFDAWSWNDFATDYQRLWTLSSTYAYKFDDNITYGKTLYSNIGNALDTFCGEKGVDITVSTTLSPSYNFFKKCIDNGGIGIFGCNINTASDGTQGHVMAVEGYYQYKSRTSSTYLYLIKVADGWNDYARYVNFDFSGFTYKSAFSFVE